MARPAVGTDRVERAVCVGYALGVEFQRVALEGIADQPNEVARYKLAVPQNHDLRALHLVVDDDADLGKVGLGAGQSAHVLGFLGVVGGLDLPCLPRLTKNLAVDLPSLGILR